MQTMQTVRTCLELLLLSKVVVSLINYVFLRLSTLFGSSKVTLA